MKHKITDEIAEWHKATFPDATFESQILKLEEEIREFYTCYDNEEELADILIVSIVLAHRFKSEIGIEIFASFFDYENPDRMDKLIKKKMEINRGRTWVKVDGVYRHED